MWSFSTWERRFGRLAFPGFLRYYALLHVLVFVIQMFRPDLGDHLEFDRAKILSGEVWRIFTCFFAYSQFGGPSLFAIVLLFFAVNFAFMVNDGLEAEWGVFKTSLFCYFGLVSILLANFLLPVGPASGFGLYASAFLAFATMFPKVQILFMLIIPVRVGILGIVTAGLIGLNILRSPVLLPFFLLVLLNYVIWAGIPALRGRAQLVEASRRRRRFEAAKAPADHAFHVCAECGRSDASDPKLEFRVAADGREYCGDHLPE